MSKRKKAAGKRASRAARATAFPSRPMTRAFAVVLLALCGLGEALSMYLLYVHHCVHVQPGWRSACAVSEQFDCDAVVLSDYGSIAGVPLALIAAWFYLAAGAAASLDLRASRPRIPRSPAMSVLAGGALAVFGSAVLALVSLLSIRSLCFACVGLYAVNLAMLGVGWFGLKSTGDSARSAWQAERSRWRRESERAVMTVVAGLSLLVISGALYKFTTAGGSDVCHALAKVLRERPGETIHIVVYSDFACPHCRDLDRDLRRLRAKSGLRFVPGHYPLDATCNPRVKRTRHPGACTFALAALCADSQGRGLEYSDHLFDIRVRTDAELVEIAGSLGLDTRRFEACLASDETRTRLRLSIDEAIAAGVRSTPTLVIDGAEHVGELDDDDLRCLHNVP